MFVLSAWTLGKPGPALLIIQALSIFEAVEKVNGDLRTGSEKTALITIPSQDAARLFPRSFDYLMNRFFGENPPRYEISEVPVIS